MYENQLLEINERALKKTPNHTKTAPLSDSPLLLQAKFPFDTALSSPSPLLSLHPAPELATGKKRRHHGHTEQVSAQHCSSLATGGEISLDPQESPLQLLPLHIPTHGTTTQSCLGTSYYTETWMEHSPSKDPKETSTTDDRLP